MLEAIVIGTSAGGLLALQQLLPQLPADYHMPLVIVQHVHPKAESLLAKLLNEKCAITVVEAEDKQPLVPGTAYMAPPGYHLLIEVDHSLSLSGEAPVQYARPSIDVLFESAAFAYRQQLLGVILTGANSDGALGLAAVKAAGGVAVVQDPNTAYSSIMPQAAIDATCVDQILPLEQLGQYLVQLAPTA